MDTTNNKTKGKNSLPEARTIARRYSFKGQFRASQLLGKKSYWQRLPELNIQTPEERLYASIGTLAEVDAMPELPLDRNRKTWMRGGNKGKLRSDHPLLRFVSANLPNDFARVSATVISRLNHPRFSGKNRSRVAQIEERADGGEIQYNAEPAQPRVRNGLTADEQCDIHQTVAFTLVTLGHTHLTKDDWSLCFSAARAEIGVERYADYAKERFVPVESVPEVAFSYTPATRAMVADAHKRQRIAREYRKANQLACLAYRNDKSRKRRARFARVIHTLRAHLSTRDCALFEGQSESTQRKLYFDLRQYLAEGQRAQMRIAIAQTRAMVAVTLRKATHKTLAAIA